MTGQWKKLDDSQVDSNKVLEDHLRKLGDLSPSSSANSDDSDTSRRTSSPAHSAHSDNTESAQSNPASPSSGPNPQINQSSSSTFAPATYTRRAQFTAATPQANIPTFFVSAPIPVMATAQDVTNAQNAVTNRVDNLRDSMQELTRDVESKDAEFPKYRGGNFVEWADTYDLLTSASGYDDAKKRRKMPMYLTGYALEVFRGLATNERDTYVHLREALRAKLQPADAQSTYTLQMLSEVQKENETVDNFTSRILKMGRAALPDIQDPANAQQMIAPPGRDVIMREAYIRGLKPELRSKVIDKNPVSFAETIEEARKAEQKRSLKVKYAASSLGIKFPETTKGTTEETKPSTLMELTPLLSAISKLIDRTTDTLTAKGTEIEVKTAAALATVGPTNAMPNVSRPSPTQTLTPATFYTNEPSGFLCGYCFRRNNATLDCRSLQRDMDRNAAAKNQQIMTTMRPTYLNMPVPPQYVPYPSYAEQAQRYYVQAPPRLYASASPTYAPRFQGIAQQSYQGRPNFTGPRNFTPQRFSMQLNQPQQRPSRPYNSNSSVYRFGAAAVEVASEDENPELGPTDNAQPVIDQNDGYIYAQNDGQWYDPTSQGDDPTMLNLGEITLGAIEVLGENAHEEEPIIPDFFYNEATTHIKNTQPTSLSSSAQQEEANNPLQMQVETKLAPGCGVPCIIIDGKINKHGTQGEHIYDMCRVVGPTQITFHRDPSSSIDTTDSKPTTAKQLNEESDQECTYCLGTIKHIENSLVHQKNAGNVATKLDVQLTKSIAVVVCEHCGRRHHTPQQCWGRDSLCTCCGRRGHLSDRCSKFQRSQGTTEAHTIEHIRSRTCYGHSGVSKIVQGMMLTLLVITLDLTQRILSVAANALSNFDE